MCYFVKPISEKLLLEYDLRYLNKNDVNFECWRDDFCSSIYIEGNFNSDEFMDYVVSLASTVDSKYYYYLFLYNDEIPKYGGYDVYKISEILNGINSFYMTLWEKGRYFPEQSGEDGTLPYDGFERGYSETDDIGFIFWDEKEMDIKFTYTGL